MKKKIFVIAVILLVLLGALLALRALSGEDDWICQDGQWVKHGQPSAPAPEKACK